MNYQTKDKNSFSVIYSGGDKRKRYRILYCDWGNFNIGFEYRCAAHWFESFDGCLGYMAGRGFIETHDIPQMRNMLEEKQAAAVLES